MKPTTNGVCRLVRTVLFLIFLMGSQTVAFAQGGALGKTNRQIVAMGIVKWNDFYCSRNRWSTATQAEAVSIFGTSLRRVNEGRIAASSLSSTEKDALNAIRRLATDYSTGMLEIAARDGGTMWIPMRAGVTAGVEGLVADLIPLLGRKPLMSPTAQKEKIRHLILATEKGLQLAAVIVKDPASGGQAVSYRRARASFETIKKQYARAAWPGSVVVLDWYAARAGVETSAPGKPMTPLPGSLERKEILNALRPAVERTVKKPVMFVLGSNSPKVRNEWAYVSATTQTKNGQPLGDEHLWGETSALLRRQNGKWKLLVWGFATDTSVLDEAMQKYPEGTRAIFGLPEK